MSARGSVRTLLLILLASAALLSLFCTLSSCGESGPSVNPTAAVPKTPDETTDKVLIVVRDYGQITVELYPSVAPVTVRNFKKLVLEHYYDGTVFHRVINGFMIQGGAGAPSNTIKGEFKLNGFNNSLHHERGVISMARATAYDSASTQFFICQDSQTCASLDTRYAAFGRVLLGLDVVDAIAGTATDNNDRPVNDVVIESIRFC